MQGGLSPSHGSHKQERYQVPQRRHQVYNSARLPDTFLKRRTAAQLFFYLSFCINDFQGKVFSDTIELQSWAATLQFIYYGNRTVEQKPHKNQPAFNCKLWIWTDTEENYVVTTPFQEDVFKDSGKCYFCTEIQCVSAFYSLSFFQNCQCSYYTNFD